MIQQLNLDDEAVVTRLLIIQQTAYRIEADLIGFDDIPPLHDTPETLRATTETFYGFWVDDVLAGAIAVEILTANDTLDICRMMVHPDYFRRGIATSLLNYAEAITIESGLSRLIVSTGTLNGPARQLYERHGFLVHDTVSIGEGVTLTQYEKQLT